MNKDNKIKKIDTNFEKTSRKNSDDEKKSLKKLLQSYKDDQNKNEKQSDVGEDGEKQDGAKHGDLPFPAFMETAFLTVRQHQQPRKFLLKLITCPYPL